jgi:hypothetical protein
MIRRDALIVFTQYRALLMDALLAYICQRGVLYTYTLIREVSQSSSKQILPSRCSRAVMLILTNCTTIEVLAYVLELSPVHSSDHTAQTTTASFVLRFVNF